MAELPTAPRRRGRPRKEEGPAVTSEAIVGTALLAIQANGWSGMALREVARRLGVSLPAVQRHFPTKDDLWRACIDRLVDQRLSSRPLGEAPPAPGGPNLLEALRAQFERPGLEPGLTAAMLSDRSEGAEARLDYLCSKVAPAIEQARGRIEEAQAAGVVRPVDTDVVLALLGVAIGSLASAGPALRRLFGIDLDDPAQRDHLAATLADILIVGLRVTPAA